MCFKSRIKIINWVKIMYSVHHLLRYNIYLVHNGISTLEESLFHFSVGCRSCAVVEAWRACARGGAGGRSARCHSVVCRGGGTASSPENSPNLCTPSSKLSRTLPPLAQNVLLPSFFYFRFLKLNLQSVLILLVVLKKRKKKILIVFRN